MVKSKKEEEVMSLYSFTLSIKQEFLCCKLFCKQADTWICTCVQMLYLSPRKLDVILGVPYDPIVIAICNSKHPPPPKKNEAKKDEYCFH